MVSMYRRKQIKRHDENWWTDVLVVFICAVALFVGYYWR